MLFETFFSEGFVLDRLEEPAFGADADPTRFFDLVFREIPPALVCRMRLTAAESGVSAQEGC